MRKGTAFIVSTLLTCTFALLVAVFPTCANADTLSTSNQTISGVTGDSLDQVFSTSVARASTSAEAELNNLSIDLEHNIVTLSAEYRDNEAQIGQIEFSSQGTLARASFESPEIYVAELSDNEELHFVRFYIDTHSRSANLITQLKEDGTIASFEWSVDNEAIEALAELSSSRSIQTLDEDESLEQYIAAKNLIPNNDNDQLQATSSSSSNSTSSSDASREISKRSSTRNGYKSVIDKLNLSGSLKLSNYASTIDSSFFKSNGWHHASAWGATPYAFCSYVARNGSDEYLVQFALLDVTKLNSFSGTIYGAAGLQMAYYDGILARYTPSSDTLSVMYYANGPLFNNVQLAINGLTNRAIFFSRTAYVNGGAPISAVTLFSAIIDPLEAILDVFDHMSADGSSLSTTLYDQTYAQQVARYGGRTVRGIAIDTDNGYLNKAGQLLNLQGGIRLYSSSSDTDWTWKWNYVANHSL